MVDFTQYNAPGVYVEEEITPLVSVIGTTPTVIGIVGPSVGYRTFTEAVTLTGTTAVSLSKLGIDDASLVVRSLDGATTFDLTADYLLVEDVGEDGSLTTYPYDDPMTIARSGGSAITSGQVVVVSYRYTDTDYHTPQRFTDYETVKEVYGEPFDSTTGAIISPLSLGAKVAFENGAQQLVLLATSGAADATSRAELAAAYTKLTAMEDVNVVVPLPVGIVGSDGSPGDTANIGLDLKNHITSMANEGVFRIGIIGLERTNQGAITPSTTIQSYTSSRILHAWPYSMSYWNGFINQTVEVSGYYLACAYAGVLASLTARTPLTKKVIRGFSGIPGSVLNTMSMATKNAYSKAGVAVTERAKDGKMTVRHGVSTDITNIYTREISLTRAKDALINLINETFDATEVIGSAIDLDTPARLKSMMIGILESAVQNNLIVEYAGVAVRQRTDDPTIVEIKFQYKPAYPLNYVVIGFSINVQTGETTLTAAA